MPQHSQKNHKTAARADISDARKPESTYIAHTERPALERDRADWIRGAYTRGVTLKGLIKGSGLRVRQVLEIVQIDADTHPELVAELEKFRTNLLNNKE